MNAISKAVLSEALVDDSVISVTYEKVDALGEKTNRMM